VNEERLAIGPAPLDPAHVIDLASGSGQDAEAGACGAVVSFIGNVRARNQGRHVLRLEYEAYEPLAIRAFQLIVDEVLAAWPSVRIACHHRIGRIELGEASVVIAAASPHRAEAFFACRYVIERIKQVAPIWKREFFEGGDVWIEGATADPTDEGARAEAMRRSCV
jgi:molybdopterin synthase catalytic subunit